METREKILQAAYRCFSHRGFMGATTREIARQAGVSEVTLFRHFKSKRELFEEVLNRFSVLPDIEKIAPERGSAREVALEILKSLKEKRCFIKILLSEVSLYPKEVRKIYERFLERLDFLIARILGCEREVARAFHSALFGYFLSEEIFMGRELSLEEVERFVDRLVKLFGAER
jgi:AcrR family transcriptional regulator